MSANVQACELCGKRLVFLLSTVITDKYATKPSSPAAGTPCVKLETFHCPVDRDDECYPNSHYYVKVGNSRIYYKEYHFDRFSVAVDFDHNETQFFEGDPSDYPHVPKLSLPKVIELHEILRYYKTWVLT